jgi:carbonic anhydrase
MILALFLRDVQWVLRKWARDKKKEDPAYFDRLCAQQTPDYLWIGCADSRVPVSEGSLVWLRVLICLEAIVCLQANTIIGLDPGEVFVQRNVGNQVRGEVDISMHGG